MWLVGFMLIAAPVLSAAEAAVEGLGPDAQPLGDKEGDDPVAAAADAIDGEVDASSIPPSSNLSHVPPQQAASSSVTEDREAEDTLPVPHTRGDAAGHLRQHSHGKHDERAHRLAIMLFILAFASQWIMCVARPAPATSAS